MMLRGLRSPKVWATCSLLMISAQAQSADLSEIYQLALENDASYQIAKLNHEANTLNLPLAQTAFRPSVSASGSLGRMLANPTGVTTTEPANSLSMNLGLVIYDKSERIEVDQAKLNVASSQLALENAKHDLILRVASRYFSLLAALDQREVARVQKAAIDRQMELADERLEVGLGTKTDVFDAKARLQQAITDEIKAQNLINNNVALLTEMIGRDPGELRPLAHDAPLELPEPNNVDRWVEQAMQNNTELKIQALNLEVAKVEIEKKKSVRTPQVSIGASHSWNESGVAGVTSDSSTTAVRLNFSVPLYSGGAMSIAEEKAKAQHKLAEQVFEQAQRQAKTITISEFLSVNSGLNQANALSEAIVAGENALVAKEEGFSAGLTTNIDVLDAQRDLSQSQKNYLQARYDYILSMLQLERVTGQLDEDDIGRINNWLGERAKLTWQPKIDPAFVDTIPELHQELYAINH